MSSTQNISNSGLEELKVAVYDKGCVICAQTRDSVKAVYNNITSGDHDVASAEAVNQIFKRLNTEHESLSKLVSILNTAKEYYASAESELASKMQLNNLLVEKSVVTGLLFAGTSLTACQTCNLNQVIQDILVLEKLGKLSPSNPVPDGIYKGDKDYGFGRKQETTDFPNGHSGIDISPENKSADPNPDIHSAFGGRVTNIRHATKGYGNSITVETIIDGKRYQILYAHLQDNSISVKEGDLITGDTIIAKMGTTGASTGEHLHFEMRVYDGTSGKYLPTNPIPILNSHGICL